MKALLISEITRFIAAGAIRARGARNLLSVPVPKVALRKAVATITAATIRKLENMGFIYWVFQIRTGAFNAAKPEGS
jgi:hypothetical protein